jgi:hypothetical protein
MPASLSDTLQELLLILAHPTDQVLDSDPAVSDKVLAVLTSSTSLTQMEAYFWCSTRLTQSSLQWRLQCVGGSFQNPLDMTDSVFQPDGIEPLQFLGQSHRLWRYSRDLVSHNPYHLTKLRPDNLTTKATTTPMPSNKSKTATTAS